jgi:TRAP-type C4-dicarboxylate transport system permease small subunit
MYRKINKGRSITKILIYSVILTWFTVILVENWQDMRISWVKEVWEFVDLKAIGHYIEDHIGIYIVFGGGIVMVYHVIAMFARAKKDDGVPYDYFEEPDESNTEYLARRQAEREVDLINNPAYHHLPDNIWHKMMKHKDEDE